MNEHMNRQMNYVWLGNNSIYFVFNNNTVTLNLAPYAFKTKISD